MRATGRFIARKRPGAGNGLIGASWRAELSGRAFQELMAEKKKVQAIKGTRDLLPPETELWNRVEQAAREVFSTFGFGEIRPPIFERTELFARSIGADTDIVGKEMYTFEDRPEESRLEPMLGHFGKLLNTIKRLMEESRIPNTPGNALAMERM